jgi:FkbM family methyltransferase
VSLRRKARVALAVLQSDGAHAFLARALLNVRAFVGRRAIVDECEIVARVLEPSRGAGIMVDVGAHFGAALDRFALAGWRVVAFEPDVRNREKLTKVYGGFRNVRIDARALSDAARDDVPFYTSEQSTGISGLVAFDDSHKRHGTISTTTLGHVIEELGLEEITFLKVDTEGFDLLVLKGLPYKMRPDVIVCEFADARTEALGYTHADLAVELQTRGYAVVVSEWYPVSRYGQPHKWRRAVKWPAPLLDSNGWGNFIAAKDPDLADRIVRQFLRFERA